MNVLPRVLYLFQSLPVQIPMLQFMEWDKKILRFIWNGVKPKSKYSTLKIPKKEGGLALPNFKEYYYAAQLKPMIYWCISHCTTKWKEIVK